MNICNNDGNNNSTVNSGNGNSPAKPEVKSEVEKFMELYLSSAEVRREYEALEASYPGSLEIREPVVEEVLLPFAKSKGFDFSLSDLRKYETRVKMNSRPDVEIKPDDPDDEPFYFLLDHGWSDDESKYELSEKPAPKK